MTVDAPAKINLGLHVLRRRTDGYHDIETIMLRLRWSDTIEAQTAPDLSMTCSDPALSIAADNLCLKAADLLNMRFGSKSGARLDLTKRIPVGAGLGGGSSDAAATLRLLTRLWDLPVSVGELREIAAHIGSDVPFFLGPSPALAQGRGEILAGLVTDDGIPLTIPFSFVVVKPEASVTTADAYRWVTPSDQGRVDLEALIRTSDLAMWRAEMINDFELPVEERVPEVKSIKLLLYAAGAGFAGMSGSGSAVYGVFQDADESELAAKAARRAGYVVWNGRAE